MDKQKIPAGTCSNRAGSGWEIRMNIKKTARDRREKRPAAVSGNPSETALAASELRYRRLFEAAKDGILILDAETGIVVDVNPFLLDLLDYPFEEFVGKAIWELGFFKDIVASQDSFAELQRKKYIRYENKPLQDSAGRRHEVEVISNVYLANNRKVIQCNIRDNTEHKKAEVERETLQAQLTLAHKMESVGRLAGGVAHDFNNMLGVIFGYTEMALDQVDPALPLYTNLLEIKKAAERSATLTRQLLAFARKQTIIPTVSDLNDAVSSMLKMLGPLIGEDINLVWLPGTGVHSVRLDPSQIDQILANLCINARDSMSNNGKIILKTANISIGASYCAGHAEIIPGDYVSLEISDNGCGMSAETLAHIFEPFFTTKDVGKGTGLGLATVYGIVKQNNGYIYADSEPGKGTTFRIYLPQIEASLSNRTKNDTPPLPAVHGETILLVEDEPSLRTLYNQFLSNRGYTVLLAETPQDALGLFAQQPNDIQLLLTDVLMPGMNGKQVADEIHAVNPAVKVLFMSGYTTDVIADLDVLEQDIAFIAKPFSCSELARKVQKTLGYRETVKELS